MSQRGICLVLCGLAVCAAPRPAGAVIMLHDQFLEDGALEGKTPMPGPGAAWSGGGGTNIPVQVANGQAVIIQTDGGLNGREPANIFGVQAASTIFARFDFQLPALDNVSLATDVDVADEGVFFVTLRGDSPSTTLRSRTGVLNPLPLGDGDYRFAINADSGNLTLGAIWPSELDFDTTYRAVISFDASTAQSKLWIDPVNEMSTSVSHTGVAGSIGTIIDRFGLRQNDDYAGKQLIDNVVVATTFADALSGGADTGVAGDYNGNSVVDAADYVAWRDAQAAGATMLNNRDPLQTGNPVGAADYEYWRARFGNTSKPASGSLTSVPEPASAMLLIAGVVLWGTIRRR